MTIYRHSLEPWLIHTIPRKHNGENRSENEVMVFAARVIIASFTCTEDPVPGYNNAGRRRTFYRILRHECPELAAWWICADCCVEAALLRCARVKNKLEMMTAHCFPPEHLNQRMEHKTPRRWWSVDVKQPISWWGKAGKNASRLLITFTVINTIMMALTMFQMNPGVSAWRQQYYCKPPLQELKSCQMADLVRHYWTDSDTFAWALAVPQNRNLATNAVPLLVTYQ